MFNHSASPLNAKEEAINCSVIEIMCLMIVTVVIIEEFSLCQYGERY